MTNFIEEQQRKAQEGFDAIADTEIFAENGREQIEITDELQDYIDKMTAQTITNTLNHLLESGLLEEKDMKVAIKHNSDAGAGDVIGHNTLARAVKEFISNMDKV